MRTWWSYRRVVFAALAGICWCGSATADDKPDGFALLKQYPKFVTLTEYGDLGVAASWVDITLCRQQAGKCERFESAAAWTNDLADYVYLFAIYKGNYSSPKAATGKDAKSRAAALLQEAQDKGYGKAMLDYYAGKTSCAGKDDVAGCVLHTLYGRIGIQRYIVERDDTGGVSILTADENGTGDVFAG